MLPFFATSEILKRTPRRGWRIRGIENGESVAEHMYQMSLICLAYPWASESDRARSVEIAVVHDAPEAIAGDTVPSDGIDRETKHIKESLGLEFLRSLARQGGNAALADRIKSLWDEYEEGATEVSKVVHQIDKLEALQQAYLYAVQHREIDLADFAAHRNHIADPWLAQQADEIVRKWEALGRGTTGDLAIIFVIGGPGVGKGTQSALAAERLNYEHISVGELLREEEKNADSEFSSFIRDSFRHSVVVPALLTMQLLDKRLQHAQQKGKAGVLVDGFPRSFDQLEAFRQYVTTTYATIAMDCSDDVLLRRLSKRAIHSGREDDEAQMISRRVRSYRESHEQIVSRLSDNWLTRVRQTNKYRFLVLDIQAHDSKITCEGSIEAIQVEFQRAVLDASRAVSCKSPGGVSEARADRSKDSN